MSRLLAFVGAFVGGWLGWWAGTAVGTMTAFVIGIVGTAGGVYLGRRIGRYYFQ